MSAENLFNSDDLLFRNKKKILMSFLESIKHLKFNQLTHWNDL